MKMFVKTPRIFLLVFFSLLSCGEDEPTPDPGPNTNTAIIEEEAQISAAYTDIDNISLFSLQENGQGLRTQLEFTGDLCPNTEVVHDFENMRIVIDFGEGCTSPNGIFRRGKLLIDYTGRIVFPGVMITVSFDNYHINDIRLEGSRVSTNRGIDLQNGTITFETVINNGKLTWPDGSVSTIALTQNRKFFLPMEAEGIRAEVTGSASGKSKLGVDFDSQISEPLIFFQTCTNTGNWIPSIGKSLITVSGAFVFEVDYGEGECDRTIEVTLEGQTTTLDLD
jgi:hypothetical protein